MRWAPWAPIWTTYPPARSEFDQQICSTSSPLQVLLSILPRYLGILDDCGILSSCCKLPLVYSPLHFFSPVASAETPRLHRSPCARCNTPEWPRRGLLQCVPGNLLGRHIGISHVIVQWRFEQDWLGSNAEFVALHLQAAASSMAKALGCMSRWTGSSNQYFCDSWKEASEACNAQGGCATVDHSQCSPASPRHHCLQDET